jgi:hypothetical protein
MQRKLNIPENVKDKIMNLSSGFQNQPPNTTGSQKPKTTDDIDWANANQDEKKKWYKEHMNEISDEIKDKIKNAGGLSKINKGNKNLYLLKEAYDYWSSLKPPAQGSGIKGGRIGIIGEKETYLPFGKYHINHRKLDDNLLLLRSGEKRNGLIPKIPPLKISDEYKKVYHKILGGELPNITNLSPDEKSHLHSVLKNCHLLDKIPIDKNAELSQDEKENARFEILRGELCAGNTSKEIISELKKLLMKFIKNGKLQKNETYDILMELTSLSN